MMMMPDGTAERCICPRQPRWQTFRTPQAEGRLSFRAHALNIQTDPLDLRVDQISSVRKHNNLKIIPNGLAVTMSSGPSITSSSANVIGSSPLPRPPPLLDATGFVAMDRRNHEPWPVEQRHKSQQNKGQQQETETGSEHRERRRYVARLVGNTEARRAATTWDQEQQATCRTSALPAYLE
jgi:hypothetical protein